MKTITTRAMLGLLAIVTCVQPALSQQQLQNNQPMSTASTAMKTRIQAKLKLDYKQGLIDSTQLASMQRDFDGILAREDDFKSRGQADGLTSGGRKRIIEDLEAFEARVDKQAGVTTTKQALDANGPSVNQNNADLSTVAPTVK